MVTPIATRKGAKPSFTTPKRAIRGRSSEDAAGPSAGLAALMTAAMWGDSAKWSGLLGPLWMTASTSTSGRTQASIDAKSTVPSSTPSTTRVVRRGA